MDDTIFDVLTCTYVKKNNIRIIFGEFSAMYADFFFSTAAAAYQCGQVGLSPPSPAPTYSNSLLSIFRSLYIEK
jgi:hypothetical protein